MANGLTFLCKDEIADKIIQYLDEYKILYTHIRFDSVIHDNNIIEALGNDNQQIWMTLNYGKYLEHNFYYDTENMLQLGKDLE